MPNSHKFHFGRFLAKRKNFRIVVLGTTGSGKTFFCTRLCRKHQQNGNRVLIVDTKREFEGSNYRTKPFSPTDLWTYTTFQRKMSTLSIDDVRIDDIRRIAEYCALLTWEFALTLYVEEVAEVVKKSEHMAQSHKWLYKVNQQGRAKNCNLITSTQRFQQLNDSFLEQSTDVFLFKIRSGDLKKFEDRLGIERNTLKFPDQYSFYHIPADDEPMYYTKV